MKRRHTYGPVPSRRLGRSLGVDLIPYKTCSYDCTYCQLGRTTVHTMERREWVNQEEVVADVAARIAEGAAPDWITLGGSGEPTLHSGIGYLVTRLRELAVAPVAVLTNGSLLWRPDVSEQVVLADLVIPSLDAGDPERFQAVNRPCAGIDFDRMVEGLRSFRRMFHGQYWLEVMLVGGVTDEPGAAARLADVARSIGADRIQLNTVIRPPADRGTRPLARESLEALLPLFGPTAEVIAPPRVPTGAEATGADSAAVLDLVRRRPCEVADIAVGLSLHPAEASKLLEHLLASGDVERIEVGGKTFFRGRSDAPPEEGRLA